MSNEVVVPEYLRKMMAEGTVQDQTAQMNVGGGGTPRLTTKGKTFRFKDGEDEVKAGQEVDLVIVGLHPAIGLSHTFYKDGYTPDASSPPDCSSMSGAVPDSWIANPVHPNCSQCPNAVWGSAQSMSGGKAKACRDSKQLYVAKAEDFAKDPEKATLYLLQVTVNSLKAFSTYGKELSGMGLPGAQFVITRVNFDDEASVPKLEFTCIGALNQELGVVSHARSEKKEWSAQTSLPPPTSNNKQALPDPSGVIDQMADQDATEQSQKADLDGASVDSLIDNW